MFKIKKNTPKMYFFKIAQIIGGMFFTQAKQIVGGPMYSKLLVNCQVWLFAFRGPTSVLSYNPVVG